MLVELGVAYYTNNKRKITILVPTILVAQVSQRGKSKLPAVVIAVGNDAMWNARSTAIALVISNAVM